MMFQAFKENETKKEETNVDENVEEMFCNPYFKWNPFKESGVDETEDKYIKDEIKKKRFTIDIHPRILFSNDSFTEAIINSGADQYIEFCSNVF
jgi:RAB protein geranylgeranyltransferase component A